MSKLKTSIVLSICLYFSIHSVFGQAWLSNPESVAQFRDQVELMAPSSSQFEMSTKDLSVPLEGREIKIRIYNSDLGANTPALIYVHGACWVAGSLNSHDEICRYLALNSGVKVIAIDYRLAPEHKYPAAHDDVYEVCEWIFESTTDLGIDPKNIAIGGESAGAYFAAATSLRALDDHNGPKFKFQILIYAAIDGGGGTWNECKTNYFSTVEEVRTRYGSPLWAKKFSGLPPTYNIRGEFEISRAEEELFMQKLADQGVETANFLHENVAHDVGPWLEVENETAGHLKAVEFIRMGFNR